MDTRTKVEGMFMSYHDLRQSLDLLAFRIGHFSGLSVDRVIEELTFTSPDGERVSTSGVSDKTSKIAIIFRGVTDDHNEELIQELTRRYHAQKGELELLEYCISLLEKELSNVIVDMVINGLGGDQLNSKYNLSKTTLGRYRRKAIRDVTKMFEGVMWSKYDHDVAVL